MSPVEFNELLPQWGITHGGLARLLNVSTRTISRWSMGEIDIPRAAYLLILLAATTGKTPAYLHALIDRVENPDSSRQRLQEIPVKAQIAAAQARLAAFDVASARRTVAVSKAEIAAAKAEIAAGTPDAEAEATIAAAEAKVIAAEAAIALL
jgi:DNA-binding transcriptional regulator YiaG